MSTFVSLLAGVLLSLSTNSHSQEPAANPPITPYRGQPVVNTEVRNGEVLFICGADLVVRLENGRIAHFVLPEAAKFNVNGKSMAVDELKPGMRLTQTISTAYPPEVSPRTTSSQLPQNSESTAATTPSMNPVPSPERGPEPSKELPATATSLPLLALAALSALMAGWAAGKRR